MVRRQKVKKGQVVGVRVNGRTVVRARVKCVRGHRAVLELEDGGAELTRSIRLLEAPPRKATDGG